MTHRTLVSWLTGTEDVTEVINGDACTTRLIHRGERQEVSWWQQAVICDVPGAFADCDLTAIFPLLPAIRRLGFEAILLRVFDLSTHRKGAKLPLLVKEAHGHDLKVLVRPTGADTQNLAAVDSPPLIDLDADSDALEAQLSAAYDIGVDGVDLGMINDEPDLPNAEQRTSNFSATVNRLLAQLADLNSKVILTAEATRSNPEFYKHHLTEDWFHHLRDDSLFATPWNAAQLQQKIRVCFADHDSLGQAIPWRPSLGGRWSSSSRLRGVISGSWEDQATDSRYDAMMTFTSSLPGAIYLPFRGVGGEVWATSSYPPQLRFALGTDAYARFRRGLARNALQLRRRHGLGTATLAFVDNLPWANKDVSVHLSGKVMVVLNTSTEPVVVPVENQPLLYSAGFFDSSDEGTILEPETCAWFTPAPHQSIDTKNRKA